MKFSFTLFSALLLFCTTQGFAQQDELSDYEIQKNFKTQYQEFKAQIDSIAVGDSTQVIMDEIQEFGETYQPHEELLDKALYPDTYEGQMEELNQAATLAVNRLQTIEQQDDQLTTLQLRLLAYLEHVDLLNQDIDSLKQAMQESIESEQQLSGMVRNYRQNLEERDELILDFIDSTVVAYQQMDLQALQEIENMNSGARLNSDGDALKMIRDISAENLTVLKENSNKLRLEDYMRMHTVQQRFEDMWNRLGNKITQVYGGNNADEIAQEVDENVAEWDQLLKEKTFATLNDSLKEKGLELNDFEDAEGFNQSLNAYLDMEIEESRGGGSRESYEHFQAFKDFWNKVERQWSGHFADANIMTNAQVVAISEKTDTWSQHAEPESNMMTYLLILAGIAVLVLGGLLIREKTKENNGEAEA